MEAGGRDHFMEPAGLGQDTAIYMDEQSLGSRKEVSLFIVHLFSKLLSSIY